MRRAVCIWPAASCVKKVQGAAESCNCPTEFRHTTANFWQKRSRVFKISILTVYSYSKSGYSVTNLAFLDANFSTTDFPTISRQSKI